MSSPVATAEATATAVELARKMADRRIGSVVIQEDGELLGIVTERDLIGKVLAKDKAPDEVMARDLMSIPVVTIAPSAHIDDALETMAEHGIRHLVVVLEDELRGVVTVTDLARTASKLDRRLQGALGARWED